MNNKTTLKQNPKREQPQSSEQKPQGAQPQVANGVLRIRPSPFGQKATNDPKNWD